MAGEDEAEGNGRGIVRVGGAKPPAGHEPEGPRTEPHLPLGRDQLPLGRDQSNIFLEAIKSSLVGASHDQVIAAFNEYSEVQLRNATRAAEIEKIKAETKKISLASEIKLAQAKSAMALEEARETHTRRTEVHRMWSTTAFSVATVACGTVLCATISPALGLFLVGAGSFVFVPAYVNKNMKWFLKLIAGQPGNS